MKKMIDITSVETILSLIKKYKNNSLDSEELNYLNNWKNENEDNQKLFEQLLDESLIGKRLLEFENVDVHAHKNSIFKKIGFSNSIFHFNYFKLAAASVILIIVLVGAFAIINSNNSKHTIAKSSSSPKATKQNNSITLTLSDGRTIVLDKAQNGKIASQGNVDIINNNGKISYISRSTGKPVNGDNIVTIPKGKSYELVLPDNTKVWLNAGTTIKYPLSFSAKERVVAMSGEAYFEVTKDKHHPFIVMAHNAKIEVLGTHFDIKGYPNQEMTKTTLLEGSVKINALDGTNGAMLKPGEQAQIIPKQKIKVVDDIDPNEILAWKNNMFIFHNTDLRDILETISNWYDVKIYYKDNVDEKYTLTIDNSISLPQLLKYLENSGGVHFKIENNAIIVNH